MIAEWLFV